MVRCKLLAISFLLLAGSFIAARGQDCDCYTTTRAQGVKLMQQKQYAKAIEFFNAAADCPDKPANDDLARKREECRSAIAQAENARQAELQRQQEAARQREEAARQAEAAAKKGWMDIKSITFGNEDYDRNVLTAAGSVLYTKEMRYLAPKVRYDGLSKESNTIELYWKIYWPDGTLSTGQNSPEGYTSHGTYTINSGTGNELSLIGWGNKDGGTYSPGTYRFELWYDGNLLKSATFRIESDPTEKTVTYKEVTVDHNVYQDGQKGMKIHVKFSIKNCKGDSCRLIAYFYYADGSPVKDTNGLYKDAAGNVSTGTDFKPGYDDTSYEDLVLFIPISEIHSTKTSGTVNLYFNVSAYDFTTSGFMGKDYKYSFDLNY